MSSLVANRLVIRLDPLPKTIASIDVHFDGYRVWSIDLKRYGHDGEYEWPESLHKYLKGNSRVRVSDTLTGNTIASANVEFSPLDGRVHVVNKHGVRLAINKWGRLAPDLQAMGPEVTESILKRATQIIDELRRMGLRPFIVGGTLLGGVREGKLLPHDDDADIAYLSTHTNPVDVALEGYRVGRRLQALGYELMRHSATHMQLHFRDDHSHVDYYIDVFAAFFSADGHINQPFHVRGPMRENQMLPFGEIDIQGHTYPVPADLNHWLTLNYDEHWRVPNPGFTLETPSQTRRRFQNWFGSYNFNRHFWNGWYSRTHRPNPWRAGAEWLLQQQPQLQSPHLVGLGSGDAIHLAEFDSRDRKLIATDYAHVPLKFARKRARAHNMRVQHVNFYRLTTLALPFDLGITDRFDVIANHLLDEIGHIGRLNVLRLIRMSLRSGGRAFATFHEVPSPDVDRSVPTTWHLTREQLISECADLDLEVSFTDIPPLRAGQRATVGASFSLSTKPIETKEPGVPRTLSQWLRGIDPRVTRKQVKELKAEIAQLKSEIDEYRAQSNRVAELLEMAEHRFASAGGDELTQQSKT